MGAEARFLFLERSDLVVCDLWEHTVAYGLKMFLADGPIGSWEP